MATPKYSDDANRKKHRRLTEVRLELSDLRQRKAEFKTTEGRD